MSTALPTKQIETLTLSYRPNRFKEMVGQKHVRAILQSMVKSESMPPALIFGGIRGTGKTTSARILAAALNCHESSDGDACGACPSCKSVQNGNSMSVVEVDAASNGGVAEVRKIRDICQYAHDGDWRVILLDEAHSMTKEAFNALLKILEEPPPGTVFVLLTTEANRIIETVRSRSMSFEFRRITNSDIVTRLKEIAAAEEITAQDDLLDEIASQVSGGMRDAVMALDQCRRIGITNAAQYLELFGTKDSSEDILRAAALGDYPKGHALIAEQYRRTGDAFTFASGMTALVRDLLILRAGGTPDTDQSRLAVRQELAGMLDQRALVRTTTVLWELQSRLSHFQTDHRAAMEMSFVLIAEAISGKTAKPAAVQAPSSMSLDAMKASLTF